MNIFVVLRSSKERSFPIALEALKAETSHYTVVEAYPFQEALKEMFIIASRQPFPYLLALDADVILHPGSLEKIAKEAARHLAKNPDMFFLDFFVMDKFRGKCCSGCHLYVNRFSQELSESMREEHDLSRPENALVMDFAKEHQLKMEKSSLVTGLHDFEQYYRDLYAKYFRRVLRRREEAPVLRQVIEERRRFFLPDDRDFDVVLKAIENALAAKERPATLFDARLYPTIETIMKLQEKSLQR